MQQNNGLDRNQIISFLFFSLVAMGFMFYFQREQAPVEEENATPKTEQSATPTTPLAEPVASASPSQKVSIKNEELTLEFSSLGGQLSKVQLNDYKAYNAKTDSANLPLELMKNNSQYGFQFKDKSGNLVNTKTINFSPSVSGNTVTMTGKVGAATIQYIYTLLPKYTVDFKVKTQGLSAMATSDKPQFTWDYKVRSLEKGRSQEQQHSEFSYTFNHYKDYDYDARTEMSEEDETLNWLGIKQQFFASVIEAKDGFKFSKGNQELIEEGEYLKDFDFNAQVQTNAGEINQDFTWYFMPLDLDLLKSYDKNFGEILPLGWSFIGTLNRWFFIPVYDKIASWGIAAGWVIFLITIFVKLILSPVMYRQHKLSAMMRVIRPEIDEVNEKYKDADPMKKQQETMAVYRKAGVNQMAGCLPALFQLPIFYALFRFFPNFIDLRGKSFWFVKDLTAYDDLIKIPDYIPFLQGHISIFALLCTVVVLIYTIMNSGNMQQPTQPGMPNMKIIMYIFPVTFFFFLNNVASGLSWYYFVSNAINILIILVIKYVILDEKKIHAQIQANKSEPKKESRFQKRMREMMEKAQEQQKAQDRNKKK